MAKSSSCRLQRVLAEHYGLEVLGVERILKGLGTRNWLVATDAGRFFLKEYPSIASEEEGLCLGEHARRHGVPVPAVRPTLTGRLICENAFALFDYVADATSGGPLSVDQMAQAGRVLGTIHGLFRRYPPHGEAQTPRWLAFDAAKKGQEIDHYLQQIDAKPEPDAFDLRTRPLLLRRKELLPEATRILERLPPLTSQVIHDDYSSPNLLFRGPELIAVVDFRPPCPFLVAYEHGRIALAVANLGAADWLARAVALIEAYCSVHDAALDDVRYAPHVWLVQLIRSLYGVNQHYTQPLEFQSDLDEFWFRRACGAEVIFKHLDELEEAFVRAWMRARR
jgi:homoserine kinase type II